MAERHFIYSIRHIASGKRYIGRTIDVVRRWSEHARNQTSLIGRAIRKHGIDAFQFEVIGETTKERAVEVETWHIHCYDCLHPKGYNLLGHGEGCTGHAPESRLKMSESQKGRVKSEETRARLSAALSGRGCGVVQYGRDGVRIAVHSNAKVAAANDESFAQAIRTACNSECGTARGFRWRFITNAPSTLPQLQSALGRPRAVEQVDRDGIVVGTFESVKAAATAVGAAAQNISTVLAGRGLECKGFFWRYVDGGAPAPVRKRGLDAVDWWHDLKVLALEFTDLGLAPAVVKRCR